MSRYFIIYKPYRVLSQFTGEDEKKTLKDFFDVPSAVYPVGRLDFDSEGLLILSDDKKLNHLLLNPAFGHHREYLVQVEGIPSADQIRRLSEGVTISINGKKYITATCDVAIEKKDPKVPARVPPIRFRKEIPESWIRVTLAEGKNRQVRKMMAAVGLPTLRLIRWKIEKLSLDDMQPGEMIEMRKKDLYNLLRLKNEL